MALTKKIDLFDGSLEGFSGPDLIFNVMASALGVLPNGGIWARMYYLTILLLTFHSMVIQWKKVQLLL